MTKINTLGQNYTLAELIKFAPEQIDFDQILADLEELEGWRDFCGEHDYGDTPDEVHKHVGNLETEVEDKEKEIEILEDRVSKLEYEIDGLKGSVILLEDEVAFLKETGEKP